MKGSVAASNKTYFDHVIERDGIEISKIFQSPNGKDYIYVTDIGRKRWNELIKDALCEKERQKNNSNAPVYTKETIQNPKKLNRLRAFYGYNGFYIYSKDAKKLKK